MSLISMEDLFAPRHRYMYSPNLMTSIFNDSLNRLHHLERQLGKLENQGEDGKYTFQCSVAGYRPQELSVDVQGEELVIQGKHQQQADGQSIHRTFERRLTLPQSVDKQSIQCHMDEQGRLQIQAARKGADGEKKVNIPIGFKTSDQQQKFTSVTADKKTGKK